MSQHYDEVDVLAWLPRQSDAVLAGQILHDGDAASYCYDRTYLTLPDATPLFTADLPLSVDRLHPPAPHRVAPTLRDALPDRWGRRVIAVALSKSGQQPLHEDEIDDITLMLQTGSDRIGALDFRRPNTVNSRDGSAPASLGELMALADLVGTGSPLPPSMHHLVAVAASVGGARPKSLFTDTARNRKFIAKFSIADDSYPVVCAEFVAMRLAALAGLNVAPVEIARIGDRDVLLVERFDRIRRQEGWWERKHMVSALTWTQADEMSARHITYPQLAGIMDRMCKDPVADKEELFTRIVFNILVGNTDDHARNHAAFWDGRHLALTPAYDILPQRRTTRTANLAMALADGSRAAQLANAAAIAPVFGISGPAFRRIRERLVGTIVQHWLDVCDEAGLVQSERAALVGCQLLNEFAFEGMGRPPRLR